MSVPDKAVDLVAEFEGFSPVPYQDIGGCWTIGYGSTRDIDGRPVTAHTPQISIATAMMLARRDLEKAAIEVDANVRIALTDDQVAALEDFIYNVGSKAFRSSAMLRKLNAGDIDGACAELQRWCHVSGNVIEGLLRRRQAEAALLHHKVTK